MSEGRANGDGLITFTEEARRRVLEFLRQEEGELAVRIAIRDSSPLAPEYDLALVAPEEREADDRVVELGGFTVVVEGRSAELLAGTRVDWVEDLQGGGFRVENPNLRPIGAEAPSGPLAERVAGVIESRINPGIAAHGGHVSLVDLRDGVVYLQMRGGCQGCGMASVTLKQGIERILREAVPEVTAVRDVTDHAAGTNPYYQPAK